MGKKKKKESMDSAPEKAHVVSQEVKLSFDQWWIMLSKRRSMKPHMKEIIWADFNARDMEKEEPASRYDEALKLFGL